ncbi:MAG: hypothetical protein N2508_12820, partial [Anaerolineae bacterium]|nr:hypothetical protein [Anaerolineae bacterium]
MDETIPAPTPPSARQKWRERLRLWVDQYLAQQYWPVILAFSVCTGLLGICMIAYALAGGPPAPAPTPTPRPSVQLSPGVAAPGAVIVAAGSGWQPGDTVLVHISDPTGERKLPLAYAQVAGDGSFTVPCLLPADQPWASLSQVQVTVRSLNTAYEVAISLPLTPVSYTHL